MKNETSYTKKGYLNENFRLFHLKDNAGQELDYHFHEFDKIVFLFSGGVNYMVEGTTCPMQPGDIVLVKHHTIHKADIDRSVQYDRVIIYLAPGYIERFAPEGQLMSCFDMADRRRQYLLRPEPGESKAIARLLGELEASLDDTAFGAEMLRGSMMLQLLILLDRVTLAGQEINNELAVTDPKIAAILSYINENLACEMTVETLSDMAYMSRYHFMRLFKAQTGSTVHAYIRQKRLLRAAQLIREGTPIIKAAAECGFNDYSSFHRAFRDTFNISPAELKR